jgi:uncharacterized membrane protein YhiD involved in acid resistance
VAVGAGRYLLGVGGAALVVGTLFGLRRASSALQRLGVSREQLVLVTRPGFDLERIVDAAREEKVDLRGLDRQEGDGEDRVLLVVKLRPRYRPERLVDVLGRLDGVRQVEWER